MDNNKFDKDKAEVIDHENGINKKPEHEPDCSGEEVLIYQLPVEGDSSKEKIKNTKLRSRFITLCKPVKERPRSFLAGFIILFTILLLYFLAKQDW